MPETTKPEAPMLPSEILLAFTAWQTEMLVQKSGLPRHLIEKTQELQIEQVMEFVRTCHMEPPRGGWEKLWAEIVLEQITRREDQTRREALRAEPGKMFGPFDSASDMIAAVFGLPPRRN